jgi:hypothetical protein
MFVIDLKTGAPEPWHELQVAAYFHGNAWQPLDFDPDTHTYKYQGVAKPSVTQILDEMGEISEYSKRSERARERGLMVHIAGSLLPDRLDWTTVDSAIFGYVASLAEWFARTGCQVDAQEQRVYLEGLEVAGTLDLRCTFDRGASGTLYLQQDGSLAKFQPTDTMKSWIVFVSIVNHWKWRKATNGSQRRNA